jgi:hypothetical protein
MIVMTADPLYAKTAYDQMSAQNRNVAYIGALPLDCKKAHQFLLHRLARERISGAVLPQAGELMPFLKEAIDALFEPGSAEPRAGTITHPVGWLRRMLYRAWKDQLSALAGSPDVAAIKLEATFIGPAEIRRATSNVFRGSAR